MSPFAHILWATLISASFLPVASQAAGFESLAGWIAVVPSFSEEAGLDALKTDLLQELDLQIRNKPLAGPVASPSCTGLPTITDFFASSLSGATVASSAPVDKALLKKTNPSLAELWAILRSTAIGSSILKKFEPKYGYEVRVVFSDLKSDPTPGAKSAALYRPQDRTIVIQQNRQAGEIAFVLLHEMVHALDGDYRRALDREKELRQQFAELLNARIAANTPTPGGGRKPTRKTASVPMGELAEKYERLRQFRDMRVYRAERFAYDASYQAWVELSALYPDYYQGRGLSGRPQRYSDEWLGKILRIKSTYLDKYRQGQCRAVQNLDTF